MANSNGNTFSFIPHACYFPYHPSIAATETRNLATLFSTKMRGVETQSQEHQHLCLCSTNNKTLSLLYACKVIYLINKGVILPYVQKQEHF